MSQSSAPERWAPIPGWEGLYEASDHGRIRSVDRVLTDTRGRTRRWPSRVLNPRLDHRGRERIGLCRGSVVHRNQQVHVLVAEAFHGKVPPGMIVRHDNGNHLDNRLENLRIDTPSSNNRDKVRHGTDWNANKPRCPRGHRYAGPNLALSYLKHADGVVSARRYCKACNRAKAHQVRCRRRGVAVPSLQEWSDKCYENILAGK